MNLDEIEGSFTDVSLNPTRVGMNLNGMADASIQSSLPHASGDEPVIGNRVIDDNSSAPREWG